MLDLGMDFLFKLFIYFSDNNYRNWFWKFGICL